MFVCVLCICVLCVCVCGIDWFLIFCEASMSIFFVLKETKKSHDG